MKRSFKKSDLYWTEHKNIYKILVVVYNSCNTMTEVANFHLKYTLNIMIRMLPIIFVMMHYI